LARPSARAIEDGHYDLITFGRWFLASPDHPDRIRRGSSLNIYDREKFYGGAAAGYTDYPNEDDTLGVKGKYALIEQADIGSRVRRS